jgi:hypothetical protein
MDGRAFISRGNIMTDKECQETEDLYSLEDLAKMHLSVLEKIKPKEPTIQDAYNRIVVDYVRLLEAKLAKLGPFLTWTKESDQELDGKTMEVWRLVLGDTTLEVTCEEELELPYSAYLIWDGGDVSGSIGETFPFLEDAQIACLDAALCHFIDKDAS